LNSYILKIENLCKYFPVKKGLFSREANYVRAVDNLSLSVKRFETLGLIGESGCGKSTLARTILRLIEPTSGNILFNSENLLALDPKEIMKFRQNMQIIYQDPFLSLNPRRTILKTVGEPFIIHGITKGLDLRKRVAELLTSVGLKEEHLYRYPHEFSGGQRQRIGIARALALNPSFLILDEPTSALDVSVQAKIINLFRDIQKKHSLTFLFISHDLSVIKHVSNQVAVMYAGQLLELADNREIFTNPLHPYTQALLSAVASPDLDRKKEKIVLKGQVPSLINPPSGCRFHPRCSYSDSTCSDERPEFKQIKDGHFVACHNE
jgi:oligopeptide/dipeptide ABC transporter ATP-binding protein